MPFCLPSFLTIASAHPLTNDTSSTNYPLLFGYRLFALMESRPDRQSSSHHIFHSRPSECPLLQFDEYRMCSTVNPSSWTCDRFLRIQMFSVRLYSAIVVHGPSCFHLHSCVSHFPQPEHSSPPPLLLDPRVDQSTSLGFSFPLVSMRHSATAVGLSHPLRPYPEVRGQVFPRRNVPNKVLVY